MKKAFIWMFAIIFILSLTLIGVGCKEEAAPAEEVTEEEAAPAEEAAETTSETEKFVIGYASMGDVNAFHALVTNGMKEEVAARGYELIALDNNWDSETTVKNVEELVLKNVDVIITGVSDSAIVPVIKEKADTAGIQLIFIDHRAEGIPFFGGDNIVAGGIGGEYLGNMAKENWGGDVDLLICLEFPTAGEANELRMKDGYIDSLRKIVDVPDDIIYRLAGNNDIVLSTQLTQDTVTANPEAEHILIACLTDDCAQGALAAAENLDIEDKVFICGQGFYDEITAQNFLTEEPTAWGATVAYWPSKYAYFLFEKLDLFLKDGTPLPDVWTVKHILVNRENVEDVLAGNVDVLVGVE